VVLGLGFIWRLLITLLARLLSVIADDLVPACKLFWVWGFFMGCLEERVFVLNYCLMIGAIED
jgi:hypothetical protein